MNSLRARLVRGGGHTRDETLLLAKAHDFIRIRCHDYLVERGTFARTLIDTSKQKRPLFLEAFSAAGASKPTAQE